jgi:hypothetical protein
MQVHQIVPEPELLVPPDAAKVEAIMRPSATFNAALASV